MATFASVATGTGQKTLAPGTITGSSGVFHNSVGSSSDYLILVAQGTNPDTNTYPVTINSINNLMVLQPGSKQIALVGCKTDGLFDNQGSDIWCVYGDHTFTADRPTIQSWTSPIGYRAPRAWFAVKSTRMHHLGCTFHDCATAIFCSQKGTGKGALQVDLRGIYIHDTYPSRTDDVWHSDCIADNEGKSSIACDSFTFMPQTGGGSTGTGGSNSYGSGIHQECHDGDSTNVWTNGWIAGSANTAIECFGAGPGPLGVGGHLDCTLANIWHWSNNATPDISIGGNTTMHQSNMHASAPASPNMGVNDPAALWRKANPYSNWQALLPFLGGQTVPGAPINVTSQPGNGLVVVSYAAPASNGGAAIDRYRATLSTGQQNSTPSGTVAPITVTATNGVTVTATVAAHNVKGFGPESVASNAVTPFALTVPTAPRTPVASAGDTNAGIMWQPPTSNGGATITLYRVTATPGGATQTTAGTNTGLTFSGLTNGVTYTFTVAAQNSQGFSPESVSTAPVTPTGSPPPPAGGWAGVGVLEIG